MDITDSPYFPPDSGNWDQLEPESLGWDINALEEVFQFTQEHSSTRLLFLHQGRIVAERYWELDPARQSRHKDRQIGVDSEGRPIEDVASIQKSVVALLCCTAKEKGLICFEDEAGKYLGKGWTKASEEAEKAITLQHLLSMSCGLNDALEYEVPAGEKWFYNTGAYQRLIRVLESVTKLDINEITSSWLTEPIGMADSRWVERKWARGVDEASKVGFATTNRDLSRLGILVLGKGKWDGTPVVNSDLLAEVMKSSQASNPSYGFLWWLNCNKVEPLVPPAPPDLVAGLGALDRKLYVVPGHDLVITRFGDRGVNEAGSFNFNVEFWSRFAPVLPKG